MLNSLILAASLLICTMANADTLQLCDDHGQAKVALVICDDAILPEQTAAQELQYFLGAVTGADFIIKTEAQVSATEPQIVIGAGAKFRAACPEIDLTSLGKDGIVLRSKGNVLYVAGGRPRGTLYAAYTLLEEQAGIRWWSSYDEDTYIPNNPDLTLPELNVVYTPKLQYREAFYRNAFESKFAARLKHNGHFVQSTPEYGDHYTLLGWCHTFDQLLPPGEYFADHPEWYSEINGERTHAGAQLCLTNDEMRAELTRKALEWIAAKPEAGMISIAQNDWHGPCQCENCQAIVDREESQSGPLIEFVNKVAADIEKQYPDFLIETLAYQYTRKPPKFVKPRDNVVVRLCTIECSFVQPLAEGPQNESFRNDIEGWSAIAPKLYVWDYVTNFANYLIPQPNLRVLAPNIRYFVDNKCVGLFEQGDAGSTCGDFVEMRAWVLGHLMWDPTLDEDALFSEFIEGYYGPAAVPIKEYLNMILDAAESKDIRIGCYSNDTSAWMTLETINRSIELWDQAVELVKDDPVLAKRVDRSRMSTDYNVLQRYYPLKCIAKLRGIEFKGPKDPAAAANAFCDRANSYNIGTYREGAPFSALEEGLRTRFSEASARATVPAEAADLTDDQWLDIQQNEFSLANAGVWVTLDKDPAASDGGAARMPANHTNWAVQFPLSGDLSELGSWHCYAVVKVTGENLLGDLMTIGIYDGPGGKDVIQKTIDANDIPANEYVTIDLGVQELKSGFYFWVSPTGEADTAEDIFVDRFFITKE